jgi:succinate dehydrogenase / fumarate reductase, membrane anchor subunit
MASKTVRSMRTPLARVRGLGSAKEGVHHWWAQRLTAIALVPLTLWFVISVAGLAGMDHAEATAWIGSPAVTVLLVLLVAATFWHAQLGVQVVIEDYVHNEAIKLVSLVAVKFAAVLLAVATIVAVLRLAFGG